MEYKLSWRVVGEKGRRQGWVHADVAAQLKATYHNYMLPQWKNFLSTTTTGRV